MTVKKWWQRYWALVRWYVWYWQQRQRAVEPDPRQHPPTCAADGAHEVPQEEDAGVTTERRVLAALYEAGKRELP